MAEIIFLFASVFIFRSLWLLIDLLPVMHGRPALIISLVISTAVTIPALRFVIKNG